MISYLQTMLQQAIQDFQIGNLDGADSMLKKILQIDSKNLPALQILGLIKASQSSYKEAADYLGRAARIYPNDASIQYNLAKALSDSGDDKNALIHHKKAVTLDPNNPNAWLNYGKSASNLDCFEDALNFYKKASSLKCDYIEAALNISATLKTLKRYEDALACAEQILSTNPNVAEAWSNKGLVLKELKRYDEAIAHYEEAIKLKPNFPEAWTNKAIVLFELKRYEDVIAHYEEVIKLKPNFPEAWSNIGIALYELKRYDEAIAHYDQALIIKADFAEAWSNKGLVLMELKRYDEAIAHYEEAIKLKPNFPEAWSNIGIALYELKRYDEAIAHYDQALIIKPDYAEAWSNKGMVLYELKRYEEAITHYDQALIIKPDFDWLPGNLLFIKMKICIWSDFEKSLVNFSKKVTESLRVSSPLVFTALTDDNCLLKKSSEIYIQSKYPFNPALGPISKYPRSQKIRVGYFSADFHNHATGYLIAELFELHDKSKFELIGFSFGPVTTDEMHQRLEKPFEHFIEVSNKSDVEIARLSRNLNIDIAVDLKGYTQDARTGIFAHRAAPIQVNYLGYPGTMGTNYIDYIVADKFLISSGLQSFYSEKVIYLPNSYQVNDRKRLISDRQFTRQELGLPENGFVFCCFNNNFKILPTTFASWMRILRAVKGSVLWLLKDNIWAADNLKKEAEKQGITTDRLIFAERLPIQEHLARHRYADLFLDTFPYNAHTTTSDALWTGLPVLTLMGNSFASRVAASLLNAIGLPELITNNQEEYETLAIELAKSPEKLASIKQKLVNNRLTTPLFDTPLFTKNLESAFKKMYERYQQGLEPDHIEVT
jgi:protein O-GlcNAc transferase